MRFAVTTLLALAAASTLLVLACTLRASAADPPAGVIRVTATCPGADIRTLDEMVLMPILKKVNDVEKIIRIETEARNDGTGTLTLYFAPETDLSVAEVRVQNRVHVALATIPESCRQRPISVRKLPAGPAPTWLALTSSDPAFNEDYLKNYATMRLKPAFDYVYGVADVRIVGGRDIGMRVGLNLQRLAAYDLTTRDVIDSLRRQTALLGAGGAIGGGRGPYAVAAVNRPSTIEDFESVVLRAAPDGTLLRLKDVARVELSAPENGFTRVDGGPAVLLAITPWSRQITSDSLLKKISPGDLMPGLSLEGLADRSADHLLSVEVQLPPGLWLEQTDEAVAKATEFIRALPTKPRVFAFADNREPHSAMIFVKPRADGGPTVADVDKALAGLSGVAIRVGDVAPGEEAFPVRIALLDHNEFKDPREAGEERLRSEAERVIAKLAKEKEVVGPAISTSVTAQHAVDVVRDQCAQFGVELSDVYTTLQAALGGVHTTDFSRFGKTFQVTVEASREFARFPDDLSKMMVRGKDRELISLDKLIKLRRAVEPTTIVRVNGYRTIIITAAPAPGRSTAQAAAKFAKLAQEALSEGYRAMNLTGTGE